MPHGSVPQLLAADALETCARAPTPSSFSAHYLHQPPRRLLLLVEVFFVLGALFLSDYSPDSEAARKLLWTSLCSSSERRGGPYARGGSEHGVRKVPAHRTVGLAAASTGATTHTRGVIKHYARDTRTPLDGGAAGGGGGSGGPAHRGELHGRALLGQVEIYLRDGRPLPASDPLLIVGDHLARHAELTDDFLDLELAFTGWMYQRLD